MIDFTEPLQPMFSFTASFVISALSLLLFCAWTSVLACSRLSGQPKRRALVITGNVIASMLIIALFTDIVIKHDAAPQLTVYTNNSVIPSDVMTNPHSVIFSPQSEESTLSFMQLADRIQQTDTVILEGDGLSESQWQTLKSIGALQHRPNIQFAPATKLIGLTDVHWPKSLPLGKPVQLHMRLSGIASGLVTIRLSDPTGTLLDEQTGRDGDQVNFTFTPKSVGLWQYNIQITDRNDMLLHEQQIALYVSRGDMFNVLIVQSAPSFETRHLSNWLADTGHAIRTETMVSKDKWVASNINISDEFLAALSNKISTAKWQWADIAVMDMRAFHNLSAQAFEKLQNAVNEGLGLYLLADASLNNINGLASDRLPFEIYSVTYNEARPQWDGVNANNPLNVFPMRLKGGKKLITDHQQASLVNVISMKKGAIALSMLTMTYQWRLEDNSALHSQYWQTVFENLGRKDDAPVYITDDTQPPLRVNQPFNVCFTRLNSNSEIHFYPIENEKSIQTLRPLQLQSIPFQSCVRALPRQTGWHSIDINGEQVLEANYQYIYAKDDWRAWYQQSSHNATMRHSAIQSDNVNNPRQVMLPKLWIFIALIVVLTLLWLEQKWFYSQSQEN